MPRSFVSSLLLLSAVAAVAAGCGSTRTAHYSTADVQAAFAHEGIGVFGPRDVIPDRFDPVPKIAPKPHPEMLTTMLRGVRNVFLPPRAHNHTTILRGPWLLVFVYPDVASARNKVRGFADVVDAETILHHQPEFGYAQKGNVVVDYRVYVSGSRVPGYLGRWESVGQLDSRLAGVVVKALARLG